MNARPGACTAGSHSSDGGGFRKLVPHAAARYGTPLIAAGAAHLLLGSAVTDAARRKNVTAAVGLPVLAAGATSLPPMAGERVDAAAAVDGNSGTCTEVRALASVGLFCSY